MILFKKYFYYDVPSFLLKELYKIKNKEKNNVFVNITNSGLKDLKEDIKVMSEKEKENEKPDKVVKIVEEILKFNKQNQEGKGIKILLINKTKKEKA